MPARHSFFPRYIKQAVTQTWLSPGLAHWDIQGDFNMSHTDIRLLGQFFNFLNQILSLSIYIHTHTTLERIEVNS